MLTVLFSFTGQMSVSVFPGTIKHLCEKGLSLTALCVFQLLIVSLLSILTSLYERCAEGSNSYTERPVNLLHLRKPEKVIQELYSTDQLQACY